MQCRWLWALERDRDGQRVAHTGDADRDQFPYIGDLLSAQLDGELVGGERRDELYLAANKHLVERGGDDLYRRRDQHDRSRRRYRHVPVCVEGM